KLHYFAGSVPLGKCLSRTNTSADLDRVSSSGRFVELVLVASDNTGIKSMVYKEYLSGWMQPR
ncbi:hypothetical protein HD554DRAFT_2013882, partial [Boletus coccyginus]